MTYKNKITAGFTLIELSIVLVVIGLIVGGVLVGRDLIKAAEMRDQVKQIEQINSAVNTFRIKYNCLPGDCKNATQFFGSTSQPEQVTNGDGNGMICGYCSTPQENGSWSYTGEWFSVFDHLAAAKLISLDQYNETTPGAVNYPDIGFPALKIKNSVTSVAYAASQDYRQGGIAIAYESAAGYNSGGHRLKLGAGRYLENHGSYAGLYTGFLNGLNPSESQSLDTKIDDGKPFSGSTVIMGYYYIYRIPGWPGTAMNDVGYCGNYATNTYRADSYSTYSPRSCSPSIKASF